jgi:hypothetical protein
MTDLETQLELRALAKSNRRLRRALAICAVSMVAFAMLCLAGIPS